MAVVAYSAAAEESLANRKERGAFFTPPGLSSYIAEWAIRTPNDLVLEPSCGEADFLLAASDRMSALGASPQRISENLVGYEIHKDSVLVARQRLAARRLRCKVHFGDFLRETPEPHFDAVVGNPPYVRFQVIDENQQRSVRRIADRSNIKISPLSSLWMPFVIHSAFHLKPGGRLGLVLPAELLSVNYAAPLRAFLLASFKLVRLVTFDEPVFPGVQEEVVLLLADGWQCGSSAFIAWQQCHGMEDLSSARLVRYDPKTRNDRWSGLFATENALKSLTGLLKSQRFVSLESWGRIALGTVTGRNDFFVLSQDDVDRWGLSSEDVVSLSPPGSKHLRCLEFSNKDYEDAIAQGKGAYLFRPRVQLSEGAKAYVEHGEALGVHLAYKCRTRTPWWRVPLGERPDAFVTYMNAYGPSVCANEAGVFALNSCHGLFFSEDVEKSLQELLPLACWNSATMFGAEITGRTYGGGILKLEPREAAQLPVPSMEIVRACASELRGIRPYVEELLRKRDFDAAIGLVDAVLVSKVGAEESSYMQMKSSGTLMRVRRKKRSKKQR